MINNFLGMIQNYRTVDLRKDIIAGLSVGAVALPQNMAYALIIGINPVYGIYTSIVSMIIAAFTGVSSYLIVGPTNVMAIAISSTLSSYKGENYLTYIFLLTFMIGIIQLLLSFLKLGNLVNFISHPVIVGLTTGVALIIGVGQLSNFMGLEVNNGEIFFTTLYKVISNLHQLNFYSFFIGILTLSIIIGLNYYKPKLPSYLIAIAFSMFLVFIFGLEDNMEVVSRFSSSLPQFNWIKLDFAAIRDLFSSALSLAILGFIQVVSIVKALEDRTGEEIELNEEFMSQGITNIVCSFFSSFAITGSFTNTFINYQAGARTRISELTTALFFIVFLLIFSPFVRYIPVSSLAAIVLLAAYHMIDLENIIKSFKTTRFDAVILIVTFLTTIIAPRLDYAIYFGVLVSIGLVLRSTSDIDYSHINYDEEEEREEKQFSRQSLKDVEKNKCIVINLGGNLHFNSAERLKERLNESFIKGKTFVFRLRNIETIDITTLKVLNNFIDRVQKSGGEVYLSGVSDKLYDYLKESGVIEKINDKRVFEANQYILSSTKEAIENAEEEED
ncbi:MAG: SulP family inorganic anion transporter [Halanaerobiales bacterium]